MFGAKGSCCLLAYFAFSQKCSVRCGLDAEQGESVCMGHGKGIFPSLAGVPWQQQQLNAQFSALTSSSWPPAFFCTCPTRALVPLLTQCPCRDRRAGALALAEGSSEFSPIPLRPGFQFKWPFSRSNEGLKLCHMSALVKMEDFLSSCRVQKELQRVKFPVQWTLSAVPGQCLTWDKWHTHQWELEAEISKTQGIGHTKSICFYADWESDSYQIQAQKGTHSPPSSESGLLDLSMPGIATAPATAPLNTTTHMAPGRGARSAESHTLLPEEPCWQVQSLLWSPQGSIAPSASLLFGT